MESLCENKVLLYNKNTLEAVRNLFDLDKPGAMRDAVDILAEWIKEQNHFTKKDFDRRYLETMIIASKGSIERAKYRLDKACTFRTLKPELFSIHNARYYNNADVHTVHAVLPRMTRNHERVYIMRNTGMKYDSRNITNYIRTIPCYCEYFRLHDYATSYYAVFDYVDANLTDLATKLTVSDIQEIAAYLLDCSGFRLKAFYFISSSKIIEIGVAIAKQVLSAKLGERVHVLKTRESLKDVIEADLLPREYGGRERSLEELHEQLLNELTAEEHIKYMKGISSARTIESLRQKDVFNDQYLGMPGTFRVLNVD